VDDLKKLLNPESVALIGASEKEGSVARPILLNLANFFKGAIFLVNPAKKTLLGMECLPSVAAIPRAVDLAVVVVGAPLVPDAVEQCARAGVKGAVIISTMFTHGGAPDRQLIDRVLEVRRRYGIRVIGPGSVGIIRPDIGLNTSFLNVNPERGNIAFISQSGELGDATLKWGIEAGIGFSTFVSLGWMIDVDFGEVIDFLGDDLSTRSILLSMEHARNARRFMSAARGFARSKPIIVLKPGQACAGAERSMEWEKSHRSGRHRGCKEVQGGNRDLFGRSLRGCRSRDLHAARDDHCRRYNDGDIGAFARDAKTCHRQPYRRRRNEEGGRHTA